MRDIDIQQLFQKVQELKALFIIGQRVVPFLEEIFRFIEEIFPLLNVINTSLADNLQKMPKASMQLSKVSEATELATTEIMDTLDGLVSKSFTISKNLRTISSQATPDAGVDLQELNVQSEQLLNSIREDANTIIMALQIQDITSQQLAAVNHLLQMVQTRLAEIIGQFRDINTDPLGQEAKPAPSSGDHTNVSMLHRSIAFDSNAIDSLKKGEGPTRQDHVDSIFAGKEQHTEASAPAQDAGPASQDDINALFGGAVSAPAQNAEPASQDDINALFGGAVSAPAQNAEPASQDDINALFGGAVSAPAQDAGPASQDDIDALFGSKTPAPAQDAGPASQNDIDALFGGTTAAPAVKAQQTAAATAPSALSDNDADDVSQNDIDALFNKPT